MDISLHSFTARDFCARGEQGILITSWHSFKSALDEFHQSYGRFLPKVLRAQNPTVLSVLTSGSSSTLVHDNSPLESGSNYYLPGMISLVLSRFVECPICVWLFLVHTHYRGFYLSWKELPRNEKNLFLIVVQINSGFTHQGLFGECVSYIYRER